MSSKTCLPGNYVGTAARGFKNPVAVCGSSHGYSSLLDSPGVSASGAFSGNTTHGMAAPYAHPDLRISGLVHRLPGPVGPRPGT